MTADYERWQQLDFVVGIRIELSNNHTLNDKKFHDICDELSEPLYYSSDKRFDKSFTDLSAAKRHKFNHLR